MTTVLPRVFVLGSSITIQFGPYLEKALEGCFHYDRKRDTSTERAEENLDFPQGASAGDSSMVLAYLRDRRKNDPIAADFLLLSCGLHDIRTHVKTGRRNIDPETFEANLRGSAEEIAAMGLKLLWLRITPVDEKLHNTRCDGFYRYEVDVQHYNAIADRVMKDYGAQSIDLHGLCKNQVPHDLIDHVHYSEKARQEQAAFIAAELQKISLNPE
jgi:lysophospholipase L1-like esterase